jgi:Protein of unknown function (DUF4232)
MRKKLAGAAVAVAAVAMTGVGVGTAQASAIPRCHTANLKVGLKEAKGEVGMMHVGWILSLKNASRHTCSVTGHPKLALENGRHKPVHSVEYKGTTYFVGDPGAHRIVLRPGKTAVADLVYNHIRQQGTVYATYLKVTPPGESAHREVALIDRYVYAGELTVTAFATSLPF